MDNQRKYPTTLAGFYKNNYSPRFAAQTVPLDQERVDQMCEALQKAVGGQLVLREWGGQSKSGKNLPDYKIEALTAEEVAERKAFGERKKAERDNPQGEQDVPF